MFSKSKINEPIEPDDSGTPPASPPMNAPASSTPPGPSSTAPKPKATPSVLSSDLTVRGNVLTAGDIQVEGTVEGDIRAHLLTVGETATIKGEVVADDVVVNGRVMGRLRGIKVRLTSSARVEGDIIHKTIAIESGAHFEGSVSRAEDPLNTGSSKQPPARPPQAAPAANDEKS
ncbi:MAG: polymer-forming cytoskeletal protein [Pseudomonadota bacterium]